MNEGSFVMILLLVLLMLVYFLPALIAKDKQDSNLICVLNILFGWTVLVWVICLLWAISSPMKQKSIKRLAPPESWPSSQKKPGV